MSQTERLAYLDRRLRERGWVTAAEVAEKFEVTPRQVKRDIEYLRWRLDAPLVYDASRRRYLYEKPWNQFRFADERRVLFSALVRGWASSEAHRAWVTPEILESIEASVSRDYRPVAEKIRFDAPVVDVVDLEVFADLCRALRERRVVECEYEPLGGEAAWRRLEVQRLWNYDGRWYLVAWDHHREALRTFHLGRIRRLTLTSDPVQKDDRDPAWTLAVEAWMTSGSGLFRGGEAYDATVRLRGVGRLAARPQRWHPQQRDVEGEDAEGAWLDRTVPVVDTRELLQRVLGWGADGEARAPEAFRGQWRLEVARLADRAR